MAVYIVIAYSYRQRGGNYMCVWLVSRYAHVFILLSLVIVTLPNAYIMRCFFLQNADGSAEDIGHRCFAGRSRQRQYRSRDNRTGLVGHRARSLDAGDGFTPPTGHHVAPASLELRPAAVASTSGVVRRLRVSLALSELGVLDDLSKVVYWGGDVKK